MSEPARQHLPDEGVPEAIRHEEKTLEVPAVPAEILLDQDTVPVRSSLEKILRHEMLRHESSRDENKGK
jgi:hypothetical protein